MRQGQQNRSRGRGRGRKPQNPLARSYESNGPDVKSRGTAAHIAEKYMSLARDALAAGDLVAAESYFQHAEHYIRIIQAAQSQFGAQNSHPSEGPNGGGFRPSWNAEGGDPLDDGGADMDAAEGVGSREGTRGSGGRGEQGRSDHGRHGANGSDEETRDSNGTDETEAHQADESATDPVS